MPVKLQELAAYRAAGTPKGITSICSAHPLVLRAALRHGRDRHASVLIEATCNQVNHQGGYTGMNPADFARLVFFLAEEERCPAELIILGGDHLGPNPWKNLPAEQAMGEAEKMVNAYVEAGFRKIHLDASMGCLGEPPALDDILVSQRATRLAKIAEAAARRANAPAPLYILGTEVPPPGGADHTLTSLAPTSPDAALNTLRIHRQALQEAGLGDILPRVLGLVVQPGVEYGNRNVIHYEREKARRLVDVLARESALIFEAHSTDYQKPPALSALVEDGFAILKVGPELTFSLREALFALDMIASELFPEYRQRPLYADMERLMLDKPGDWESHYAGDAQERHLLRHYSLSDRIRYYWADPQAKRSVDKLFNILAGVHVPTPLLMQYLPGAESFSDAPLIPEEIVIWKIQKVIRKYHDACHLT